MSYKFQLYYLTFLDCILCWAVPEIKIWLTDWSTITNRHSRNIIFYHCVQGLCHASWWQKLLLEKQTNERKQKIGEKVWTEEIFFLPVSHMFWKIESKNIIEISKLLCAYLHHNLLMKIAFLKRWDIQCSFTRIQYTVNYLLLWYIFSDRPFIHPAW